MIPAIEAALLVVLIVADPGRIDCRLTLLRIFSLELVVILVVGAGEASVRLVIDLVKGALNPVRRNAFGGLLHSRYGWTQNGLNELIVLSAVAEDLALTQFEPMTVTTSNQ